MTEPRFEPLPNLTRRQLLRRAGTGLGALVASHGLLGAASATGAARRPAPVGDLQPRTGAAARLRWSGLACPLTPAQTEGPFYFDADLLRQDITQGKPGFPLILGVQIVRVNTCTPVPNAVVDLWHCDADGVYAGYGGQPGNVDAQGENFCRGIQVTDANGIAIFHTIYPGWYQGRTVHVHVKIRLANQAVLTSQLYFDDAVSDEVLGLVEPYNGRPARGTRNANDGIFSPSLLLALAPHGGGVAGTFTIAVP